MSKKKKMTLEIAAKKLKQAGAIHVPLSEDVYIVFYTRTMFETIESQNNIFQPINEKIKIFIPSYFILTTNSEFQKINELHTTVFNINNKTISEGNFVTPEIIEFFEENIF